MILATNQVHRVIKDENKVHSCASYRGSPSLSGQAITFLFALFAYRQKQVGKQDQKRIELPRKLINGPV